MRGFTKDSHQAAIAVLRQWRLWTTPRRPVPDYGKATGNRSWIRFFEHSMNAGIACHLLALADTIPGRQILGILLGPQRSTFEDEVCILEQALERARPAMQPH